MVDFRWCEFFNAGGLYFLCVPNEKILNPKIIAIRFSQLVLVKAFI